MRCTYGTAERYGQEQDIPDDRDRKPEQEEESPFPPLIRQVRRGHSRAQGKRERRRTQQQALWPRPFPEIADNGREEDAARVNRTGRGDVEQHEAPCLPVQTRPTDDSPGEGSLILDTVVHCESMQYAGSFERSKKGRLIRPVVDHPDRANSDNEGDETFNDELRMGRDVSQLQRKERKRSYNALENSSQSMTIRFCHRHLAFERDRLCKRNVVSSSNIDSTHVASLGTHIRGYLRKH